MRKKEFVLPEKGLDKDEIFKLIDEYSKNDVDWYGGKCFAYVYYWNDEHEDIIKEAHNKFFTSNALSPFAFPSLGKFEKEVVSMAADIFNGDFKTCGNITSGGTESILMAIKTYRDYNRKRNPQIKKPEVILPVSTHGAFNKAVHYFDVLPIYIPCDENYHVDVKAVEAAITDNTILIVGSACEFPRGGVDPIEELSKIALQHKIGLHVDSCLGGYMLAFLDELGYDIPPFDFSVKGVTSISADIHKYGLTPKGSSTLLFRNERLWKHQYHAYTGWEGGVYASPTMVGTKPGSVIAGAWAGMMHMGRDKYRSMAKSTKETADKIMDGIRKRGDLEILGDPVMTVFSFKSIDDDINMYALGDALNKNHGWILDKLQYPPALHCIVMPHQTDVADQFLTDLDDSIKYTKEHPELAKEGEAALYGMMADLGETDQKQLRDMAVNFLANNFKSR